MDENYVVIRGRLGDNPDIREKVATIRVATNSYWRDSTGAPQTKTTWVSIVMFDKNIAIAQAYLRKGVTVKITAHLQTSSWKDKETGEPRSKLEIVADDIAIVPALDQSGHVHQPDSESDHHCQQAAYETRTEQAEAQAHPSRPVPSRRPVAPMRRPVARPVAQPAQPRQIERPVAQSSVGSPPPLPRPRDNFSRAMEPAPKTIPTVEGKQVIF